MNEEVKNKWVTELRSGKHKQAKGTMKCSSGAMCCLGVLQLEVLNIPLDSPSDTVLNLDALEAAGMYNDNGSTLYKTISVQPSICLSELNDRGKTFGEIADIIEERWRDL